ncbi:hypothetical protein H2200_012959 [Cladophialophora chaetospira]|uniref:Protein required for cell viability Rrp17 n=1 Tax=Cladophialophora chaetospira TaxID=386627 RepID=A0AA38WWJ6_9EURO|nr:hypothetical protein H2200_012959 [Cladophialophora chaetospira]
MPPPTKRRRTEPTVVEEISFDLAARQEYLTGFHKRKLQRAKHAREAAEKRARAEKLEGRKQLRDHRKAELERHVDEVNAMLRPVTAVETEEDDKDEKDSDDDWEGTAEPLPTPIDHEAEYVDEEKYTTVTVEAMDVSKEGLSSAQEDGNENDSDKHDNATMETPSSEKPKRQWTKDKPKDGERKRKKKRNFRYESKVDRKAARSRQKSRNSKQARERRAGGS